MKSWPQVNTRFWVLIQLATHHARLPRIYRMLFSPFFCPSTGWSRRYTGSQRNLIWRYVTSAGGLCEVSPYLMQDDSFVVVIGSCTLSVVSS